MPATNGLNHNKEALEFDVSILPGRPRGRSVKFTPERMEQIKNLVERGKSRDEIASIIGCTVGSLQVTCSRFSISLRQPRPELAVTPRQVSIVPPPGGNGDDKPDHDGRRLSPADFAPERKRPTFALRATFGSKVYDIPLQLASDTLAMLAIAAEVRGMRLGELIADILNKHGEDK